MILSFLSSEIDMGFLHLYRDELPFYSDVNVQKFGYLGILNQV